MGEDRVTAAVVARAALARAPLDRLDREAHRLHLTVTSSRQCAVRPAVRLAKRCTASSQQCAVWQSVTALVEAGVASLSIMV